MSLRLMVAKHASGGTDILFLSSPLKNLTRKTSPSILDITSSPYLFWLYIF